LSHWGIGPNNEKTGCLRREAKDPVESCPVCKKYLAIKWSNDFKQLSDKDQKEINMKLRNVKFTMQVIDFTPLFEKTKEVPSCFGMLAINPDHDDLDPDECAMCPFNNTRTLKNDKKYKGSCAGFVQVVRVPTTVLELISSKLDVYGDITNPKTAFPLLIRKKGKGLGTRYIVENSPEHAVDAVRDALKDNDLVEDIKGKMVNLYPVFCQVPEYDELQRALTGISRNIEDEPSDAVKSCYGQYDRGSQDCARCELVSSCMDDTEGNTIADDVNAGDVAEEDIPF